MNTESFQRARSPAAKAVRRAAILAAATSILARDGLEGASLNAIAAEARVVKSNIYRYFESREEILMRLMTQDLQEIASRIETHLNSPKLVSEVARIVAGELAAQPRLCLLISITASTLEHNISTDTLREIKRDMAISLARTTRALGKGQPGLPDQKAEFAMHFLFTQTAGLWPLCAPGPALEALYHEAEFARFRQDFERALAQTFETMLKGLMA